MDMNTRSFRAARAVWVVLAIAVAVSWAVTIVVRWSALQTICHPDSTCLQFQFDASAARTLSDRGISMGDYAVVTATVTGLIFLFWYGLAVLIFRRKPDDRGALLALYFLVVLPAAGSDSWLSPGQPLDWILTSAFILTLLAFGLLFPDGRFAPRWTRWLILTLVAADVVTTLPLPDAAHPIQFMAFLTIIAIILIVPVMQIYRYRKISSWRQRQQTKWVFFGIIVAILGFVALYIVPSFVRPSLTAQGALYNALSNSIGGGIVVSAIPISIAIAVFRNQLWDIDHVINRALVYSLLSLTLASMYVIGVVGLQALFGLVVGGSSPLAIAVSTLAIAALFGRLRRGIQNGVDRRFYRRKYDATRTLAAFQSTLRDEVDLDRLVEEVVGVVKETMQPASVSLWLVPNPANQPRQ
jgi:hypothetical protein